MQSAFGWRFDLEQICIQYLSMCTWLYCRSALRRVTLTSLTCSFSPPLCRRSWSRAPSGTSRAWGWRRLNTGTHSASSRTWPRDSGCPIRHLMSNPPVWVPSKDEWVETYPSKHTHRPVCYLECKAYTETNKTNLTNEGDSLKHIIIFKVISWLS